MPIVVCTRNKIEGTWKLSKDHFRRINRTHTTNCSLHLSQMFWKNHVHYENIFLSTLGELCLRAEV